MAVQLVCGRPIGGLQQGDLLCRHKQPWGVSSTAPNRLNSGRSPMAQPGTRSHKKLLGLDVKPLGSGQVEGLCDCDGVTLTQDSRRRQDVNDLAVLRGSCHS